MTTLYRATKETECDVYPWSCWTEDLDTAEAYTEEGVGHGGTHIREIDVELDNVLDISGVKRPFEELAEALGYEDPQRVAATWQMNSWLYPWEESQEVRSDLADSGYEWLRYDDDYPEGAVTVMRIGPALTPNTRIRDMRMPRYKQEAFLNRIDVAINTLKDARSSVYQDGRFREELWDTKLMQMAVGLTLGDLAALARHLGHPGEADRIQRESEALAFHEEPHFSPNAAADEHAAQELYLYLTNTSELYGPGSMGEAIERRYARLWKKEQFDLIKAAKGYDYLTKAAAQRYVKEFGNPTDSWHVMFNAPTRRIVNRQLVDDFVSEAELGNFRS